MSPRPRSNRSARGTRITRASGLTVRSSSVPASMELSTLIEAVGPRSVRARADIDVTAVTYRAESAVPGALHACVPGFTADGHDFAGVAVANGASALIVERELGLDVPQLVVASSRAAMAAAADAFYGHPS